MTRQPNPELIERLSEVLGSSPSDFAHVTGGYTAAARWRFRLGDERLFVKCATTPVTAEMLQRELHAYDVLDLPMMPQFVGCSRDPVAPFLVIEDLSEGAWPPPWTPDKVDSVSETVEALHRAPPPPGLPSHLAVHGARGNGWETVAADPNPFLGLGVLTAADLDACLPDLIALAAACQFDGDAICHWDLRSDNMCLTDRGVVLIDWTEACIGAAAPDLGAWLPSLHQEGGPTPEHLLPDAPEVAAWVAGFFAARAGLPIIPDAPRVRDVQKSQLSTALPWALRARAKAQG
ncbi:MAG: aminoglycoside phosphotransferase family protein [Pseudomonadota bacterium]